MKSEWIDAFSRPQSYSLDSLMCRLPIGTLTCATRGGVSGYNQSTVAETLTRLGDTCCFGLTLGRKRIERRVFLHSRCNK